MNFDSYVFPTNKKDYVHGKKPDVECILCAIISNDKRVVSLKIAETECHFISVNLYPYNSGHIIVFPKRHLIDIREMNTQEEGEMIRTVRIFMDIIDTVYHPFGYNIGWNIGKTAGASIPHIHQHIIPRYPNELGIVDLIGGSKVLVENPLDTQKILQTKINEYAGKNNGFFKP